MKEYKVVQFNWDEDDGWWISTGPYSDESNFDICELLESFLNLYAADGWRLVSVTPIQRSINTNTESSCGDPGKATKHHSESEIDVQGLIFLERDI